MTIRQKFHRIRKKSGMKLTSLGQAVKRERIPSSNDFFKFSGLDPIGALDVGLASSIFLFSFFFVAGVRATGEVVVA